MTDSKATDNSDQERLANDVATAMLRDDRASQHLKIELKNIGPGSAVTRMVVRDDMVNGLGICHGGVTFTLADTTFALACNSRNRKTVALECTINFIAASKVGDVLTAEAREKSVTGRIGIYDITVKNQNGELVAEFRGTSYGTSTTVVD